MANYLFIILLILNILNYIKCDDFLMEGLYCGRNNCYTVLNVTRSATKSEISKNYRKLAKIYHPDLHKGEQEKRDAEEQFKIIATAYEILKDEEARQDYDYMLDNPQAYYSHYYRYYRRRVAPKVDVRIVIAVTITIISIIQYYLSWQRYEEAIKYFMTVPKYRTHALDQAKIDGIIPGQSKSNKKRLTKNEQKEQIENYIRQYIEENMDIKGSYAKPKITDILWIQLILLPITISFYIYWYMKWIWKFNILKQEYGQDEKLYLIRKHLKLGENEFNAIDQKKIDEYLMNELWIWEKFKVWKAKEEENMKKQLAESAKYKAYRRYIKNHGVSRMTFED